MPRSVLLLLKQLPQDPSSGAARSMRGIAELLAAAGIDVRALATTATERAQRLEPRAFLREAGLEIEIDRRGAVGRGRPVINAMQRGVRYTLLDTGAAGVSEWEPDHGRQFDRLYHGVLDELDPEFVLTFGGAPEDVQRRREARRRGALVVFGLRNLGYLVRGAFAEVDAVLTPSRFLTERYREAIGLESTPIPSPVDVDDVRAPQRDPIFTTYVNPSRGKGVMLFARLAEELGRTRPDIPLLVIESRGTAGALVAAGLEGGFDLRRHESLMISGGVPNPRDLFSATRVLLAPSVHEEAWGRVAQEALVNGVPPIVSDRGGLGEACSGAGFVLSLPEGLSPETTRPVAADDVTPWVELVARLADDEAFYESCSADAAAAGARFGPEAITPRYLAFFDGVRRAGEMLA
ncbi:MAG: glycosyltransferase family 4 protein [Planctomycetes bacterium]|nr:glycosyltransferase family 4 protein [Planctomycetota bacterium]